MMRLQAVLSAVIGLAALCALIGCTPGRASAVDAVFVEGGAYTMGSDAYPTSVEGPAHRVRVDGFWIGKTEIGYRLFARFVDETGYKTDCERDGRGSYVFDNGHLFLRYADMNWRRTRFPQGEASPLTSISWFDAVNFSNWLSRVDGLREAYSVEGGEVSWDRSADGWRLPTEAEWEYAARGGAKGGGFLYAGSDKLGEVAWYDENSGFATHPMATKKPNELGLYDMTGNVYEWCWDWYAPYAAAEADAPAGPPAGLFRCCRGGSWYTGPWVNEELRTTVRSFAEPRSTYNYNGLRLVRNG